MVWNIVTHRAFYVRRLYSVFFVTLASLFLLVYYEPLKRFFLSQKTIVVKPQYITYRDDFHRSLKSGLRSAGKERAPLLVRVVTMWFPGL